MTAAMSTFACTEPGETGVTVDGSYLYANLETLWYVTCMCGLVRYALRRESWY